jgi:hypothetical protein
MGTSNFEFGWLEEAVKGVTAVFKWEVLTVALHNMVSLDLSAGSLCVGRSYFE